MGIDNEAGVASPREQVSPPLQKRLLTTRDFLDQAGGEPEIRVEKHAAIIGEAPFPLSKLPIGGDGRRAGVPVKSRQHRGKPIDVTLLEGFRQNPFLQHEVFIKAVHDDEPVNHRPFAIDRQPAFGKG